MAKKSGFIPLWTERDIERWFDYHLDRAEEKIYLLLQRAGEEFVKIARKKGAYKDQTGNLRSSIGYVIARDGEVLTENFELAEKGSEKSPGMREAKRLTSDLIGLHTNGWVLVGVAAMPYAAAVEAIHNLDVVSVAAEETEEWIRKQSKTLFDRLAEKGF